MVQSVAIIKNEQGIHCRPSAMILKETSVYGGNILVTADTGTSDLRSVMGLMALGLHEGTEVQIEVEGPDEQAMCDRLVELFETEFDFPPK